MATDTRTAVISGGSSGIGRALVAQLHAEGWKVYTCGRDAVKLQRLERDYPGVDSAICDVTDRMAVRGFAHQMFAQAPAIDLLISNAGGLHEIDFTSADLANFDLSADLRGNAEGAVNFIAEFLPGLKRKQKASILIVSSGYALAPATRAPLYSASKAALHSLSKSLRRQLAPLGITVTELLPPVVDTPSVAHRNVAKLAPDDVARQALQGTLRGVEEVRPGAVRFLPLLLRMMPSLAESIVAKS
jgi:short-subunit dehydrogenase involved in D-alanine esterification of teichoic acids